MRQVKRYYILSKRKPNLIQLKSNVKFMKFVCHLQYIINRIVLIFKTCSFISYLRSAVEEKSYRYLSTFHFPKPSYVFCLLLLLENSMCSFSEIMSCSLTCSFLIESPDEIDFFKIMFLFKEGQDEFNKIFKDLSRILQKIKGFLKILQLILVTFLIESLKIFS